MWRMQNTRGMAGVGVRVACSSAATRMAMATPVRAAAAAASAAPRCVVPVAPAAAVAACTSVRRFSTTRPAASTPSTAAVPSSSSTASTPPSPARFVAPSAVSAGAALRSSFLSYFSRHGHLVLPSAGLVPPAGDDSLLFTSAGMVPLKEMLLGVAPPPSGSGGRLASAQKCVRAGGKHNDLENVGHTARHHTFFEMLGNFSIGAYFKEEAMVLAWNYLTKELCLPTSRLRITVLHSDDESAALWSKITGFSESAGNIVRLGEADNFWSMGDASGTPCGPCSEIFWDQGAEVDGDRWLEIWNLVFMQYARGAGPGELVPLQRPCVDTGMGLERLASVMQGVPTNYDSDILRPLIGAVEELALSRAARSVSSKRALSSSSPSGGGLVLRPYTHGLDMSPQSTALKVVVDHLRSSAFLVAEGVVPSNVGRGYVLRRIIRRAVRYGHQQLGLHEPFLADLLPALLHSMADAYPELAERQSSIASILRQEEANFFGTLARGLAVLEDAFNKQAAAAASSFGSGARPVLSGEVAFRLYDTFGFPLDLTQVIARERAAPGSASGQTQGQGWEVDVARFEELMRAQKEQSKGAAFQVSGGGGATSASAAAVAAGLTPAQAAAAAHSAPMPLPAEVKRWQLEGILSEFVGFDSLQTSGARVVALHRSSPPPSSSAADSDADAAAAAASEESGETVWLALDRSPFYANQGGQVGDVGELIVDLPGNGDSGSDSARVSLPVLDTLRPYEGCTALRVWVSPEHLRGGAIAALQVGGTVQEARVSRSHRRGVAAHHTATHLLHAALKAVLPASSANAAAEPAPAGKKGKGASASAPTLSAASINQSGSLVAPDRLRFDFSCPVALSAPQIAALESWVNDAILAAADAEESGATSVVTAVMAKEEATKMNAMALFGEKYGAVVRVVSIPGYSVELCGGTHARSVRECYPFKIVSESGIATGMRRVEAVTGAAAVRLLESSHSSLRHMAAELKCAPETAATALSKLQARATLLESQLASAKKAAFLSSTASTAVPARWVVDKTSGVAVLAKVHEVPVDLASNGMLIRECCAALSSEESSALHVLLCSSTGSVAVAAPAAPLPALSADGDAAPAGKGHPVSAKTVLARLQASMLKQGAISAGKGGGSAQVALGVLPTAFSSADETTLLQRVVQALADVDAAPATGKAK